jgi:hypothetical protein
MLTTPVTNRTNAFKRYIGIQNIMASRKCVIPQNRINAANSR